MSASQSSEQKPNTTRRAFLQRSSVGAAAIATMSHGPAVWAAGYSPNETIGVGHIGIGVRGGQLITEVAGEPAKERPGIANTQVRAVCDIYQPHLDKAFDASANANCKKYHAWEELVQDQDVDAVIIATPDHWHSPMVIEAANAGKDIYVEKCWTRTLPEAKDMLKAVKMNDTVMQLGHNSRGSAASIQARELLKTGILGPIHYVRTGIFRNRPMGQNEWRWYGWYSDFERPDEQMVKDNLDWERFLGNAPYHPFSMERFWHWRCYWDYGTGIAGDLLSHAYDFTQFVLQMGIPGKCTTSGQNNVLHDGRECPDTWNSVFEFPEQHMTLVWNSTFNSEAQSPGPFDIDIRGKEAMMRVNEYDYQVYPEPTSVKYEDALASGEMKAGEPFREFDPSETPEQPSHMQNFFDCMRTREKPTDNEDEAFVEAVTCIMSVQSYFEERTVYWDAARQEIV
mgnify:CR=1 FL=1